MSSGPSLAGLGEVAHSLSVERKCGSAKTGWNRTEPETFS